MSEIFRSRLRGHEAPVDPSAWSAIQGRLSTTPGPDGVNELFKQRFQGHEVPVEPSVWTGIQAHLGHQTAVWGGGSAAWLAAGVVALVLTTVALWPDQGPTVPAVAQVESELEPPNPPAENLKVEAPTTKRTSPSEARETLSKQIVVPVARRSASPKVIEPTIVRPSVLPSSDQERPVPLEGSTVVSSIISDLTEEVINGPVTAEPEPGSHVKEAAATPTVDATPADDVADPFVDDGAQRTVFMPNTFTPNGDGVNDTYTVDGEGFEAIVLRVYSLSNSELVFSTNTGEPWTGEGAPDGMYMVAIEAMTLDGKAVAQGKVVWLNRDRLN